MDLLTFVTTLLPLILGGFTLWIVIRQLRVMEQQKNIMEGRDSLMQQQLQIMTRQDEILSQRSRLTVCGYYDGIKGLVVVVATNTGTKTARDFYFHLWIPLTLVPQDHVELFLANPTSPEPPIARDVQAPAIVKGVSYHYVTGYVPEPLYPSRSGPVARFRVPSDDKPGTFTLLWQIVGDDGVFPSSSDTGEAAVEVKPLLF